MPSTPVPDLLFLDRDLPTTAEDVRALREHRPRGPRGPDDWWDQLTLLSEQVPNAAEALRRRPTFEGYEPFEL
jgi:hypothetical protein